MRLNVLSCRKHQLSARLEYDCGREQIASSENRPCKSGQVRLNKAMEDSIAGEHSKALQSKSQLSINRDKHKRHECKLS